MFSQTFDPSGSVYAPIFSDDAVNTVSRFGPMASSEVTAPVTKSATAAAAAMQYFNALLRRSLFPMPSCGFFTSTTAISFSSLSVMSNSGAAGETATQYSSSYSFVSGSAP